VVDDPDCVWSDGQIGSHCAEIFCGQVEIGTAVNPAPDMTDVGFGWERLHQVLLPEELELLRGTAPRCA
jgi:hypothetical protein